MRILLENIYPNPSYNSSFDHTYEDWMTETNSHRHIEDFAYVIECMVEYEQILLARLNDKSMSPIQHEIVKAKFKHLAEIRERHRPLLKFVMEDAADTL